jgi:hypothetical protein
MPAEIFQARDIKAPLEQPVMEAFGKETGGMIRPTVDARVADLIIILKLQYRLPSITPCL